MVVDVDRVRLRLDRLRQLLARLDTVRAGGIDPYLHDADLQELTERRLQLAIQACIDVSAHLASELGLGVADAYGDSFRRLHPEILPRDLADRLSRAAGMRNVLVHDYLELDQRKIFGALGDLEDLRRFSRLVLARLEDDEKAG